MNQLSCNIWWEIFNRLDDWDYYRFIVKNILDSTDKNTKERLLKYALTRQRWQWSYFELECDFDACVAEGVDARGYIEDFELRHWKISKLLHTVVDHDGTFDCCQHNEMTSPTSLFVHQDDEFSAMMCIKCVEDSVCGRCGGYCCNCSI